MRVKDLGGAFAPTTPIVPLTIDKDLDGGVHFTSSGFGFHLASSDSNAAQSTAGSVFFANAQPDTDFQVVPKSYGAETFLNVRSARSPESFTLTFDLPKGATIRRAPASTPSPGAPSGLGNAAYAITDADRTLANIYEPVAQDADGTPVPVRATLSGDDVILHVAHRRRDVHYPISVDPAIWQVDAWPGSDDSDGYTGATNWPGWVATSSRAPGYCPTNVPTAFGYAIDQWSAGRMHFPGLYLSFPTNSCFTYGSAIASVFAAPADTFISEINFIDMSYEGNSSTAYGGILNPTSGGSWTWAPDAQWGNGHTVVSGNPWQTSSTFYHATGFLCYYVAGNCDTNRGVDNNYAYIGLQSNGSPLRTYGSRAGLGTTGISVLIGDRHPPTISGTPADSSWVDDGGQAYGPAPTLQDAGLGINKVSLSGVSGPVQTVTNATCGDPYRHACPHASSSALHYTLPEGVSTPTLSISDVAGYTTTKSWTQKVDRTNPSVTSISGSLYRASADTTPVTHGSQSVTASATDTWSGVRRLDLIVDDEVIDSRDQACAAGGCAMPSTQLWFNTDGLDAGQHSVQIVVTDGVNRTDSRSWAITVAAARTVFSLDSNTTATQAASGASQAGAPIIQFHHSGPTEGGFEPGVGEDPAAAVAEYRAGYAADHGGAEPMVSSIIVGGDVPTSTLGPLASHVTARDVVGVVDDVADILDNALESTLDYLDDLLNADLYAETQPSDTRDLSGGGAAARAADDSHPPPSNFAPIYGGIETDTLELTDLPPKKFYQTLTFSKASLGQSDLDGDGDVDDDDRSRSPFEVSGGPDHSYEHDLKLYDPTYTSGHSHPFCHNVNERFWARRGGLLWDSTFPSSAHAYLDNNVNDSCGTEDFTIGVTFPLNLQGGKKYSIKMFGKSGLRATSPYTLVAQKTRRFCPAIVAGGGYCNGDAGTGPGSSELLVGMSKGRTEECRRWRNGMSSRRTCDHAGD